MLVLVTGQPGNGKTLYTLGLVEKLRQESGRNVYQSGIPDLVLPWLALDEPASWFDLPDGSIVVIDEAQRVFPPRKQGAQVPRWVSEFETHRHRGFDIYLITQHPQLLDIAVRKLVGRHYHITRTFGQDKATVRQWERQVDPHDRSVQSLALTESFPYPKERYGWYKSSDMHTVKKELPIKKLAILGGSVVGAIACGVLAFMSLRDPVGDKLETATIAAKQEAQPHRTANRWDPAAFRTRSDRWGWSAPRYDEIAQEITAPRVAGCMTMVIEPIGGRKGPPQCRCADQFGAEIDVEYRQCLAFVKRGIFDPTRPDFDAKAENIRRLDASQGPQQAPLEPESAAARSATPKPVPSPLGGAQGPA